MFNYPKGIFSYQALKRTTSFCLCYEILYDKKTFENVRITCNAYYLQYVYCEEP